MLTNFKNSLYAYIRALNIRFKTIRNQPLSLVGLAIILFFLVIALLAPVLAPPKSENPYVCPYLGKSRYVTPSPTLPSPEHPFGTMNGYDLYYACVWGARLAFYISILTASVAVIIGLTIGSIAGYFEGIVDEILMRITDAFFALPGICYVLIVVAAMPLTWELPYFTITLSSIDKIILALAITGWPPYARLIRGEIKKVKQQDFVEAAKAIGCSRLRILTRHILPNSINSALTLSFLSLGGVILQASTISFLGFGPGVGYAEWGSIIASVRSYFIFTTAATSIFALLALIPVAFLSTFILGWSLLGDTLICMIDPTLGRGL